MPLDKIIIFIAGVEFIILVESLQSKPVMISIRVLGDNPIHVYTVYTYRKYPYTYIPINLKSKTRNNK